MLQHNVPTYNKINCQSIMIRCANEDLCIGFKLISCKNCFILQNSWYYGTVYEAEQCHMFNCSITGKGVISPFFKHVDR